MGRGKGIDARLNQGEAPLLRVGIDAVTPGLSLAPHAGGMRPYLLSLTQALSAAHPKCEFLVLENPQVPLSELQQLPNVRRMSCPGVPRDRRVRILYQNTIYPLLLRRLDLDVTLFTCNAVPLGSPRPSVLVIQATQYYTHQSAYSQLRGVYLRTMLRSSLARADAAIAVSAFGKSEAVRLTGVDAEKIHVAHHGIFPAVLAWKGRNGRRVSDDPSYILSVLTLYRYKNALRLVQAYALLVNKYNVKQRLRIVGGDAEITAQDLRLEANRLGVGHLVELLGPLPHESLPDHYANADVLVYPSLYETFGHPVLEAMTIGCPVVAARSSSIPEIAGNAAELVDPVDVEDIARGIADVLLHEDRRSVLRELGLRRSSDFTWEKSAAQTWQALEHARDQLLTRPHHRFNAAA